MSNEIEKNWESMEPVLTIDANEKMKYAESIADTVWYELQSTYYSRRVVSATLSGYEETETGGIAVVYYKGHRVIIPVLEMGLNLSNQEGYGEMKGRMARIINSMIGCELDFVIIALDNEERSVVASRRLAMRAKRKKFYFPNEQGISRIKPNTVVQARVIAVAEKSIRLEIFGAECSVIARDLSWGWLGDARDRYSVGDRILANVTAVELDKKTWEVAVTAEVKSLLKNDLLEKLKECKVQGCYAGRITDIHKDLKFVSLDMGVNAVARECKDHRLPGKNDRVNFVVTYIDEEKATAFGVITKITKQQI